MQERLVDKGREAKSMSQFVEYAPDFVEFAVLPADATRVHHEELDHTAAPMTGQGSGS